MKRLLRLVSGSDAGKVWPIEGEVVLGREDADVELSDSEVSRRHAVLRPVADGIEIEDLESTNGTYVDDRRVEGKVTVAKDAAVRVGDTRLKLEIETPPDLQTTRPRATGAPAPDVTVARQVPPTPGRSGEPAAPGPDVTVPRSVVPPGAPHAAGGPPPPRKSRAKTLLPIVICGVLLAVAVGLALSSLLGGSDDKKVASTARCPRHFPKVIADGFPEPKMRFSKDGELDTTLKEERGSIKVGGRSYRAAKYEGGYPGPTLVVCPGDRFTVHLKNELPLPTNLHVHGLHVSPKGNGDNVFVSVNPMKSFTYRYKLPVDHPEGAYWYHPHLHKLVQLELGAGLAGAIIVQGALDERLRAIPQRLMVIQGGRDVPGPSGPLKTAGGPAVGAPNGPPPAEGPGQLLVNGVLNPSVKIRPGEIQRWRLFNATPGRMIRMSMRGQTFQLLAQDGNTLRSTRPQRDLLIGPGSRREVLVRGGPAGRYPMSSLPFHACFRSCTDPAAGIPPTGRTEPRKPVLTMVSSGAAASTRLPGRSLGGNGLPDLRRRHVDRRRTVILARNPQRMGPPLFPLNREVFNPNRVDITMKLGSVEEWTLKNLTTGVHSEWHTIHIHQNPVQVISVNGRRRGYVDYQDNVSLAPGDAMVIRTNPTDFTGKFVFHCHLTFHEDQGMMQAMQVVKNPTAAQARAGSVVDMGSMAMSQDARPRVVGARGGGSGGGGAPSPRPSTPAWLCPLPERGEFSRSA